MSQEEDEMPKYALLFIGNDEAAKDFSPDEIQKLYAAAGRWFQENGAKGIVRGGEQLKPSQTAKTVRKKGYRPSGEAIVTDGPFVESKEQIGGFGIVEVADMNAAVALAKTWPTGGTVEVREVVPT